MAVLKDRTRLTGLLTFIIHARKGMEKRRTNVRRLFFIRIIPVLFQTGELVADVVREAGKVVVIDIR